MPRYKVMSEGWLDGNYRKAGEMIELTDAEAKWLLRGGQITLDSTDQPAADRPADAPAENAGGRRHKKVE
jgi:hypothetical protein